MSEDVFDIESTPEFITFPDNKGKAITAAAQILNGPKITRINRKVTGKGLPWQAASWEFFDCVGEYSWAVELLATNASKARLVAAKKFPGIVEPVILDGSEYELNGETQQPSQIERDAAELVASFAGGTSGQQEVMYRACVQEIVAAESYIVGRQDTEGDPKWAAYSNEEVRAGNGKWSVDDGTEKFTLTDNDVLIRVWRPHPKKRSEPRSSSLPLLPVLAEIKGLTQALGARIDSRLAGAGVLFIPESASLMSSSGAPVAEGVDPFVAELIDSMLTPIGDRDSAAAVVPIVVRVPDESIGGIKHIRFEVETKAEEAALRKEAVERLAITVDLPREQVTGMSGMNHWGAWQVDESTVTGPVATLVAILTHALTVGYLRPGLLELGHSAADAEDMLFWYDLTGLIQRPDLSEAALQNFDRNAIGYAALLRESGFDDSDAPTEEETCRKMLLSLIQSDPTHAGQWIQTFGPCSGLDLPPLTDLFGDGTVMIPQQDTTPPVADDIENNRELPAVTAAVGTCPDAVECLYPTCEQAVLRVLELAGKRMRGSSPRNERTGLMSIPAHELHTNAIVASQLPKHGVDALLDGVWSPLLLSRPGCDSLIADLDGYVRLLIEKRQPHDPEWLRPIVARHA